MIRSVLKYDKKSWSAWDRYLPPGVVWFVNFIILYCPVITKCWPHCDLIGVSPYRRWRFDEGHKFTYIAELLLLCRQRQQGCGCKWPILNCPVGWSAFSSFHSLYMKCSTHKWLKIRKKYFFLIFIKQNTFS